MAASSAIGLPDNEYQDHGWKLYIASLVMVLAAGGFVIARCVARHRNRQLGADDYTIVLSLVLNLPKVRCFGTDLL